MALKSKVVILRKVSRRLVVLWLLIFLLSLSQRAFADGPVSEYGNQKPTVASPEDIAKAKQKLQRFKQLYELSERVKKGQATQKAYLNALNNFREDYGIAQPLNSGGVSIQTHTSENLGVMLVPQQTSYWCGPASVFEVLQYKGVYYGPQGQAMNQANLAAYMNTDTSGTYLYQIKRALNDWLRTSFYVYFQGPTAEDTYVATHSDIGLNYPVIYDTSSNSINGYLIGWEGISLDHYVAGTGHRVNGGVKEVYYLDTYQQNSAAYGGHWISASRISKLMPFPYGITF